MKTVFHHIALFALRRCPTDVGRIGHHTFRCRSLVGIRFIIGDAIVLDSRLLAIVATGEFVPLVISQAVAISIDRDHHDTRLATSACRTSGRHECVGIYLEVVSTLYVCYRVVEAKHHIPPECTKADHAGILIATDLLLYLSEYCLMAIAVHILRQFVDKLSRCRLIVVDLADIRRILSHSTDRNACKK